MIKSEIDDIFASKGKAKVIQPIASSSNTAPEKKRKKEKKKKKRRDGGGDEVPVPEGKSNTKKRPAPETVVDPSTNLSSVKKAKVAMAVPQNAAKPKARQKDAAREDEVRFKDSRGNGPRMSTSLLFGIRHESDSPSGLGRKTEEDFLIFKEDELGIGDEGGGETNSLNLTVIAYFVHLNIQTHHCVHSTVNVVSLATR